MSKKLTTIQLEESLLNRYREYAKKSDLTFKMLIKLAVNEYINRHQQIEDGENLCNQKQHQ